MQDTERRRRGVRQRIAERWTPLFEDEADVAPISDEELATACDWERLRAAGVVAPHEDPLGIAGLRRSSIFPRHLLRRRDDGRLVPIAFDDAVALVRLALAQEGRDHGVVRVLEGTAAVPDDNHAHITAEIAATAFDAGSESRDGGADVTADAGDTTDTPTTDGRGRRRFFRRRD